MSNVRRHKERALLAPAIPGFAVVPMAVSDAEEWAEYAVLPEVTHFTSSVVRSAADIVPMIERTLSTDRACVKTRNLKDFGGPLILP